MDHIFVLTCDLIQKVVLDKWSGNRVNYPKWGKNENPGGNEDATLTPFPPSPLLSGGGPPGCPISPFPPPSPAQLQPSHGGWWPTTNPGQQRMAAKVAVVTPAMVEGKARVNGGASQPEEAPPSACRGGSRQRGAGVAMTVAWARLSLLAQGHCHCPMPHPRRSPSGGSGACLAAQLPSVAPPRWPVGPGRASCPPCASCRGISMVRPVGALMPRPNMASPQEQPVPEWETASDAPSRRATCCSLTAAQEPSPQGQGLSAAPPGSGGGGGGPGTGSKASVVALNWPRVTEILPFKSRG